MLFRLNLSTTKLVLVTALATLITSPGYADEPSIDEADDQQCPTYVDADERKSADSLTLNGVACFEAGDYDWALTHYRRAHDLNSDPFLLGGIGRSLHELGLYGPAMNYYEKFLDQQPLPSGADRIRSRIDELEDAIDEEAATVSLQSAPPNTSAYVVLDNGEWYELGKTPVELRLREGDYEFAYHTDDYRPRQLTAGVDAGDDNRITTDLVSEDSALDISARSRRKASLWTMGSSLVVGAAGATLLTLSSQERSEAEALDPDSFDDSADYQRRYSGHLDTAVTTRRWGTAATAVGVTGLVTGSILYLSTLSEPPPPRDEKLDDPDESPSESASDWELTPTIGIDGIGVRGKF